MERKSLDDILQKISQLKFAEDFDMIVAIANGGIIPAALINQLLLIDFQIIKINFKDEYQQIRYKEPKLIQPIDFQYINKRILLVDDRVKTGTTLQTAKCLLNDAKLIKTFAINGKADYFLYDEDCFLFPWNV
jgi:xanthine phosphoribosyltransferase